ncbi:MAG: outer membrane beta-barrel protein [Deltaproteobacteria bacterium]|nr:outer membrane beta-barrel protein [Deltaproteobacteria bacterium]
MKSKIKILFSILIVLSLFSTNSFAAERNNDDKWFKIALDGMVGVGFEEYDFGKDAHNDDIEFYGGGGGVGGQLTLGLCLLDRLDLDISAGYQKYNDELEHHYDISFRRFIYQATLKYELARFDSSNIKIGIGAGIYGEPRLNKIIEGNQQYIEYDDAVGYHAVVEYEILFEDNWAVTFGLKGYTVEYEAEKYTQNSTQTSLSSLDSKLRDFNGDGIDLLVGVVRYF